MATEAEVIAASAGPVTAAQIAADLSTLGLHPGAVVIVHSSMSKLGWIPGGAQSVVEALLTTVGAEGTLIMPTQSGQLTDPTEWNNPPIPEEWIDAARDAMPAYNPHTTPVRAMGAIVECFLHLPDVRRSAHPHVSFAARGPLAEQIIGDHPLDCKTGEASPLGHLYELDAQVLLLGVDHGNNTSIHLAEERATWEGKSKVPHGGPVLVDGQRQWVTWEDFEGDDDDFSQLGEAFAASGGERQGPIGAGVGRLCRQRSVVDFAVDWMQANRPGSIS